MSSKKREVKWTESTGFIRLKDSNLYIEPILGVSRGSVIACWAQSGKVKPNDTALGQVSRKMIIISLSSVSCFPARVSLHGAKQQQQQQQQKIALKHRHLI